MAHSVTLRIAALIVLATTSVFAGETDRLLAEIAGNDDAARAEARQLLPRYGMAVVPELLALMTHEDAEVWRAAKNVLADISHGVGMPGYEKDRRALADQLKATATNEGPYHTRKHALRLLGITAPEGYRLRALVKLAKDATWREEVINALIIMATGDARKVLDELLDVGTGAQRAEIIEALRLITPPPGAPVSARLLKSKDVEIQVAAMRALAQTGDEKLAPTFAKALPGTTGRLHVEAVDACLQLAHAILHNGGNPEVARAIFQNILDTETDPALRRGATAGLKQIDR